MRHSPQDALPGKTASPTLLPCCVAAAVDDSVVVVAVAAAVVAAVALAFENRPLLLTSNSNDSRAGRLISTGKLRVMWSLCPSPDECLLPFFFLCSLVFPQAAVDQMETDGMGAVVEYTNLPDVMTDYIYPTLFAMGNEKLQEHLPHLSEAARSIPNVLRGVPPIVRHSLDR